MATLTKPWTIRTANPGDRIADYPQTLEEKAKQVAVDAPDITGERIRVPTYFIVEYPNGDKKALHHVKDAKEISDVIRQMALNDVTAEPSSGSDEALNFNPIGLILIAVLFLITVPILIGIF
jgi:hypothetical protein